MNNEREKEFLEFQPKGTWYIGGNEGAFNAGYDSRNAEIEKLKKELSNKDKDIEQLGRNYDNRLKDIKQKDEMIKILEEAVGFYSSGDNWVPSEYRNRLSDFALVKSDSSAIDDDNPHYCGGKKAREAKLKLNEIRRG